MCAVLACTSDLDGISPTGSFTHRTPSCQQGRELPWTRM